LSTADVGSISGGFPAGARQTQIPSLFLSDVVPEIEDVAELLVSVYGFYLLGRKRSTDRWFSGAELQTVPALLQSLAAMETDEEVITALHRGMTAAVRRRTFLQGVAGAGTRTVELYVANAPGAAALLNRVGAQAPPPDAEAIEVAAPRRNIFVLYEENIGVISPLLAEQLREAEVEYAWPWVEAAFREAVALNRRNWRYIERILQRWRTEGPDVEAIRRSVEGGRRSLAGKYWRLVRH